jgi:hypothetical protein
MYQWEWPAPARAFRRPTRIERASGRAVRAGFSALPDPAGWRYPIKPVSLVGERDRPHPTATQGRGQHHPSVSCGASIPKLIE